MDVDVDADVVAGDLPPSARQPLRRDRIVTTAVEFIEEDGLPGLTMRRLGRRLGVEAMALYRYVPGGREDLLDAVVEQIIARMQEDDDVHSTPQDGWQDFLIRLAHGVRPGASWGFGTHLQVPRSAARGPTLKGELRPRAARPSRPSRPRAD